MQHQSRRKMKMKFNRLDEHKKTSSERDDDDAMMIVIILICHRITLHAVQQLENTSVRSFARRMRIASKLKPRVRCHDEISFSSILLMPTRKALVAARVEENIICLMNLIFFLLFSARNLQSDPSLVIIIRDAHSKHSGSCWSFYIKSPLVFN